MTDWTIQETSTHQDHVIAHVLGATVLAYFVLDETAYLLLDIGFIWNVYVDGEMGLLPHPVAIAELEVSSSMRTEIQAEADLLMQKGAIENSRHLTVASSSPIQSVEFLAREASRRLVLTCEEGGLILETSLDTGGATINEF